MKILVAEDDTISLKILESVLTKKGYDVVSAVTGREAIVLLKQQIDVDIIISDIMMPDVDGMGLLKYIKANKKYQKTPVIFTSSLNDKQTIVKAMQLGIFGYIVKPINADALLAKVNEAEESLPGAVLVVDDEMLIRKLLEKVVVRDGYKVVTAANGNEALEVLEKEKISVIITDVKMPEMTGPELLIEVKERYPAKPVLLMTGLGLEFTKEEAIASGADDYITKPFKNVEILQKVRNHYRRSKKVTAKV